jgi:Spy/CpxP family protein refolding chaperone
MATFNAKRTVAVATIALAGTIGAGAALAQMAKGAWGGNRTGRAYQRILAQLNLTADQKNQIDALLATEKPVIANLGRQLKADAAALRDAAAAAQPDAGAVGGAFLKVRSDRTALRAELQKVRSGTEAVLTPDQKGAFEAYLTTLRTMRRRFRPASG